ncbi:MAG: hypothetical protein NPIRA01_01480 [Nitrospirales bacterium]|nr:MAG: hypothetical protein NPIRA01_01480 [Nitrospirales bacterium]
MLNGLYDAKLDGQPVLAITGLPYHDLIGTKTQQDVELDKLFTDVTVYNARVMEAAHVKNVSDLACRAALGYRGVAHITFPVDFQELEVSEPETQRNVSQHTSNIFSVEAGLQNKKNLDLAADILNVGEKIAILAGRGA